MMYVEEVVEQAERMLARGVKNDKLPRELELADRIGCGLRRAP